MSKLKSSAGQKAARDAYNMTARREKNKTAKIARHMKKHPDDVQSKNRVKPVTAGRSQEVKRTPFEARLARKAKHAASMFGKSK